MFYGLMEENRLKVTCSLTKFFSHLKLSFRRMAHQRHTLFKVMNQEFWVDNKFRITKELGQGAYGIVWYEPLLGHAEC
jgi:hypothetical protein